MSEPIYGTIAEEYLQRRGILLTPPSLGHYRGSMIAAVHQPYHGVTAIQKTPIKPDFSRGDRMTKGPLGNGAVRLGAAQEIMGIAEGTETALSAMMLTGMSVWASLGGKRLHNVELPPFVREVHVFCDNDTPGREAAYRRAMCIAHLAAMSRSEGRLLNSRTTTISSSPTPMRGQRIGHDRNTY
jgi:hypothetical protein